MHCLISTIKTGELNFLKREKINLNEIKVFFDPIFDTYLSQDQVVIPRIVIIATLAFA